jgi:hypothetical protein
MQTYLEIKSGLIFLILGLFLVLAGLLSACKTTDETISIIPLPVSIEKQEGQLHLSSSFALLLKDTSLEATADYFNERLQKELGFRLPQKNTQDENIISLEIDPSLARPEGYLLKISDDGITIRTPLVPTV